MVFYNSFLGIGISMNVPLYDRRQESRSYWSMMWLSIRRCLYELSSAATSSFLDQELKNLTSELNDLVRYKIYDKQPHRRTSACMQELKRKIITHGQVILNCADNR